MRSSFRVLLLHPPGLPRLRLQLDAYCSQPQKGAFRWHPVDFCCFSSKLHKDAVVEILDLGGQWNSDLTGVKKKYDCIIGLIGAFGWDHLLSFWNEIMEWGVPVFLSGDIARHHPEYVFAKLPKVAGIIPEMSLAPDLSGLFDPKSGFVWRPGQSSYIIPKTEGEFYLGIQNPSVWNSSLYSLPFPVASPFASVLTQIGCPHRCDYCILAKYPLRPRSFEELEEELHRLKGAGVRHVYIRDPMVNSSDSHLRKVCDIMRKVNLSWNAFACVSGIGQYAGLLKSSNCRLLQFGFDSVDLDTLFQYHKKMNPSFKEDLDAIRRSGIRTVGHFIYGLEKPPVSPKKIAVYADRLRLDWMTITPYMKRPGNHLWNFDDLEKVLISDEPSEIKQAMLWFYSRVTRLPLMFKTLMCHRGKFLRSVFN